MASRLIQLHREGGQSPWLDNLQRGWLRHGELARWVERGIRGVTSNPTIFAKAMRDAVYDDQLHEVLASGRSVEEAYWDLVVTDIIDATAVLRAVFEESEGQDGFVSVEVDPRLAWDTEGTVAAARALHRRIDRPNLLVKVPATRAGVLALETLIAEGISINATLIFSQQRYSEVMQAYLRGLEAFKGDLSSVASVASFFVSRVDAEVDARLEAIGPEPVRRLGGQAAVANAQVAYEEFLTTFSGSRWAALEARGARHQRPLWASTSTKNPSYMDTLYVDELIGPHTVNTMPEATIVAFEDHGIIGRTVDAHLAGAYDVLEQLARLGISLDEVTAKLEADGVASFIASFDEVLSTLASRAPAS